jgi:hypothetical protein
MVRAGVSLTGAASAASADSAYNSENPDRVDSGLAKCGGTAALAGFALTLEADRQLPRCPAASIMAVRDRESSCGGE